MDEAKKQPEKRGWRYIWREWVRPGLIIAVIVFPIKSAIADWNFVPSGSMKPTIIEGDLVFVNKLAYDLKVPFTLNRLRVWDHPKRGDVVVFFAPHDGTRMVKRVIGIPGDTIEMRNYTLLVNGKRLKYEKVESPPWSETYESRDAIVAQESDGDLKRLVMAFPRRGSNSFAQVKVPQGKYFMMGDSRDNSFDSRYFGFVDREQILGRTRNVVLSFDRSNYFLPRTTRFFSKLDPES